MHLLIFLFKKSCSNGMSCTQTCANYLKKRVDCCQLQLFPNGIKTVITLCLLENNFSNYLKSKTNKIRLLTKDSIKSKYEM